MGITIGLRLSLYPDQYNHASQRYLDLNSFFKYLLLGRLENLISYRHLVEHNGL